MNVEINGAITILINQDRARIEIFDEDSSRTFCRIELDPEHLCRALSRLARTKCQKVEVSNLNLVGQTMENKINMVKLGKEFENIPYDKKDEYAKLKAKEQCPKDWESDGYFKSQDSFSIVNNEHYAKDIIRRWTKKKGEGL
jgi:hypothetical protein